MPKTSEQSVVARESQPVKPFRIDVQSRGASAELALVRRGSVFAYIVPSNPHDESLRFQIAELKPLFEAAPQLVEALRALLRDIRPLAPFAHYERNHINNFDNCGMAECVARRKLIAEAEQALRLAQGEK